MKRRPPDSAASFRGLTTPLRAYALHLAVDLIVERVGSMLSSPESFSESDRRRLVWARAALRAAQTHFAVLLSPPGDEPADRRGGAQ